MANAKTIRARVLANLAPAENLTPSQWAGKFRILTEDESSEPGPWNNDRTPYLVEVMDAVADPGVEEVACLKGAQVGWSDMCRNVLGYWIDSDPGPTLVVAPDQKSAEDYRDERLQPLLKNSPAVRRHLSSRAWDTTKHRIKLDTMSIFLAWSGSSQGVKSRPIRYLLLEEPDEFKRFSGAGGDPISKARKRLTTYADKGRARVLMGGTPTTRAGRIWRAWESCPDRRHYWVPCPHCGSYQRLEWARVKWPKLDEVEDRARRADRIETQNLAHYECEHCKGEVRDHHKPGMLRKGKWASEDQIVTADGRVVGPRAPSKRVGFCISSLYSPWVTFSRLAAEFLLAQGDVQALADFVNQRLAQPFEEQRAKIKDSTIEEKARGSPPPMRVPRWAKWLTATADTQGTDERGHFYYVIRAWGRGYRSQLVDYGVCHSKAELMRRCLDREIAMEGGGGAVAPQWLFTDSGGPRWHEVYQMAQADNRVHPTKGSSTRREFMVQERPQKAHGVVLWLIDTFQAKELLHQLVTDPDRTRWLVHSGGGGGIRAEHASRVQDLQPVHRGGGVGGGGEGRQPLLRLRGPASGGGLAPGGGGAGGRGRR